MQCAELAQKCVAYIAGLALDAIKHEDRYQINSYRLQYPAEEAVLQAFGPNGCPVSGPEPVVQSIRSMIHKWCHQWSVVKM